MADAFRIKFSPGSTLTGLDALAAAAETNVRPAAQAGAQVLYEEVLQRVPVAKRARTTKGGKVIPPGALKASIYQAFSEDNSTADRATYHISWNHRKAPHGHLVEFGSSRAPAHPFLRPAYDAAAGTALTAAKVKWEKGMQAVINQVRA
jgi:HK97 gp10 family phage protein